MSSATSSPTIGPDDPVVFICHASEDKEEFVRPLADRLKRVGLNVWYDEFSLRIGDSLRKAIERGLAQSRFGIVILSPSFFAKQWPQAELSALVALEFEGAKSILPVWHKINRGDVLRHAPLLADKIAGLSADGLDAVVDQILDVVAPEKRIHVWAGWLDIGVPPAPDPGSGSFCSGLPSPGELSLTFDVNHTFGIAAVSTPFGIDGLVRLTATLYRLAPNAASRLSRVRTATAAVGGGDPFAVFRRIYGESSEYPTTPNWYWFDLPFEARLESNARYELAFTDFSFVQGSFTKDANNWIYVHPLYDPAEGRALGKSYEVGGGLLTVVDGTPRGTRITGVPFARVKVEN